METDGIIEVYKGVDIWLHIDTVSGMFTYYYYLNNVYNSCNSLGQVHSLITLQKIR